ncbi:MAG: hypothetical protein FJ240_13100 [Nitrospira sp.]|nr:hypothetical protein [Nitrospira sp.]
MKYPWTAAEHDFGFPLEISASFYRADDILPFIARLDFENAYALEELMNTHRDTFQEEKPCLMCYERSVAFSAPVNLSQIKWPDHVRKIAGYSQEKLASLFEQGARIDILSFSDFIPKACHQEVELKFTEPAEFPEPGTQQHTGFDHPKSNQDLRNMYINLLQSALGMPLSDATAAVNDMLKQAEEEALREGTADLPENFGDKLLESEALDENIRSLLGKRRAEGARDEDIRWWWNMDEIERRMTIKYDNMLKKAQFQKLVNQPGMDKTEAVKNFRKNYPLFGIPGDSLSADTDGPLPYELMERVNRFFERISKEEPERLQQEIADSPTMNAFLRRELRAGNL